MASDSTRWARDGDRYRRYVARARRRLDDDSVVRRAHEEWTDFFVESHGDVFADLPLENPREAVFVDALYFDYVVDRLLDAAEDAFGVRVENREPGDDTDALSVDFGSLHDRILDGADAVAAPGPDVLRAADVAFLRDLYEDVVSREVRLALGEYYTPRGLADLALDELAVEDVATESFLDPGCGSGVFLSACVDRKRAAMADRAPTDVVEAVTDTVLGIDLNPVAVKAAKLASLLALAPVLEDDAVTSLHLPVYLTDALRLTRADALPVDGGVPTVDHLVGNPPWVTWGNLTEAVREAWRETYADRLDLVPHRGRQSKLGHANDDVSVPFAWVAVHHYLREGGDASFVLKRDAVKGPAGVLLRRLQVGDRSLAMRHVHDFPALRPFGGDVKAGTAVYTVAADADHDGRVPVTAWSRDGARPDFTSAARMRDTLASTDAAFVPVDPADPASSWIRADAERRALGECNHEIRHGVKDDAKAVFEVSRDDLSTLEPDHVHPYLKSRHVVKWGLFGHDLRLVPQRVAGEDNADELAAACPRTYDYLDANRDRLAARQSSWLDRGPFYSVFGLGEYTWAEYKVVWCRLGFKPHFAVVSTVDDPDLGTAPVVPGDHCMFVATDDEREAHFLCALLNSAPYQRSLRDLSSDGKASLSKSVVSQLSLPAFPDTPRANRLADLSLRAHDVVPEHTDVGKREYNRTTIPAVASVQAAVDDVVERMLADGALGRE